jgi:hypothetical protein
MNEILKIGFISIDFYSLLIHKVDLDFFWGILNDKNIFLTSSKKVTLHLRLMYFDLLADEKFEY